MKLAELRFACIFILLSAVTMAARSQHVEKGRKLSISDFAPNPPLGYNSFDSYLNYLNEDEATKLIDVMAKKYKPFGYEYFVMDAGWYYNVDFYKGTKYPKKVTGLEIDKYGIYEPCKMYFPHGIKRLADLAHEKGLKFGVWIIRGIPREAVEKNLPIKGTRYRAKDIADTINTCAWNNSNYGIDMNKPGAQEYYNSVIDKLASWGVDFVKVDDMVPYPKEMLAVANAIKNGGHKMLYSLSPGDVHKETDLLYYRSANMVRITGDVWDNAKSVQKGFTAWAKFVRTAEKGFWPDLDMIPFGNLKVNTPDDIAEISSENKTRQSRLSKEQMRTFITQRALAASPLIIGGDLLTMDDYSYSLLTNKDMLACNQNGVMGDNIYKSDSVEVWFTSNKNDPGKGWIGIFNRSGSQKTVKLSKTELGFTEYFHSYNLVENKNAFRLKDIWGNKEFTMDGDHQFEIPADDVVFLKFVEIAGSK